MKIDIKKLIVSSLTVLIGSLICWLTFSTFSLSELFGVEPTYLHWLGISIISTLLFVQPQTNTNDPKGPKIP